MVLNPGRKIKKVSWKKIQELVDTLSLAIANDEKRIKEYNSIYGIPRNGQIIAVLLSYKTGIPIATEYILNENTIIVDDICDSGNTLQNFVSLKNHINIKNLDTATLFYRKGSKFIPTYSIEDAKDKWILMPWEE